MKTHRDPANYCLPPSLACAKSRGFFLLAFFVVAAQVNLFAQNLLVNGDFEQNDRHSYTNYYVSEDLAYIPLGDTVPGWTFSHSVDLYGPVHDPQSGSQFLDLVGGGPVASDFSIQQTFVTTPGQSYQLSFFFGNNENLASSLATFTASIVGGSGEIWTQDFSHTGDTYNAHDWTYFEMTFVADSAATTLSFFDTSHFPTNYDPAYTVGGSTLDNVRVIGVVPEPGGMVAGLGMLGMCIAQIVIRRRRVARNR